MKRLLLPVLVVAILGGAIALLISVPMQDAHANFTYLPFDLVPRDPGDFMPAGVIFNPRWDYLNNIRRNPLWGKQANNGVFDQPNPLVECPDATQDNSEPSNWFGGSRPCTTVLVTQDSGAFCGPHAEFAPVTYEGYLIWEGHSGPYPFDDDDYEIDIFRDDDNALYTGLRGQPGIGRGIEIEFDSDETIDNYDGIPWWQRFHHHVDNPDEGPGFVGGEILQKNAIIIAPADLDGSHGYSPELHPAWLFMVQYFPNFGEEHWAFFARNWGDKGYCSDADHQLPLQDIQALIRNPNAIDGFAIGDTVAIGDDPSVEGMGQQFIRGQGLAITFHLPPPDAHGWIAGDIHVGWRNADVPPPAPAPHPGPPPVPAKFVGENKPEYIVDRLVLQMKDDERAQYLKDMQACRPQVPPARGKITFQPAREALTYWPPASVNKTSIKSVVVPYRGRKPYCRQLALCSAFKGRVPGYPKLCNLVEKPPSINQTK
jgi:hypothetical protein